MFSWIRRRATYANVAMTLALVFAMTGGAYAAKKYVVTSTKQISPSVLKQLKGKDGVNGTNGSPGAQGPQGPAGANGKDGTNGTDGKDGALGAKGETGAAGPAGAKGAAGPAGPAGATGPAGQINTEGPLPSGKSESGAWAIAGSNPGSIPAGGQTAVSFAIPLAAPLDGGHTQFNAVGYDGTDKSGVEHEQCPGTVTAPKAASGFFCFYTGEIKNFLFSALGAVLPSSEGTPGAETVGVKIVGFVQEETNATASGTWMVTG